MSVYLIPCPIEEGKIETIPSSTIHIIHSLTHFVVERAKTARHFIKLSSHPSIISTLNIVEIDPNHVDWKLTVQSWIKEDIPFGLISEAGCPGIADPGAEVVAMAHEMNAKVVPLVGPSSIFLALMSSGMGGQHFTFNGYLPNKKNDLIPALKKLEREANNGQTHIFMEAPYRNGFMMEAICQTLHENSLLCVACDINGDREDIKTKMIKHWKKQDFAYLHKRPCIYVLGKVH
ncbi:MAG: SAM-dependent methyltransferase [Saprospiraceae bacterium]